MWQSFRSVVESGATTFADLLGQTEVIVGGGEWGDLVSEKPLSVFMIASI